MNAPKVLSVSELSGQIKSHLEPAFQSVWVQGELSNLKPSSAGHLYFSLKDAQSSLSAAIFSYASRKKSIPLKDGLQVICKGKLSVYIPRGSYQLIVEHMEPLGSGALQVAFEQLKKKLESEGLFELVKKRPIPRTPQLIAVVTSPTGAVIQDMIQVLGRRAPNVRILVIPAVVQGADAPASLLQGLRQAQALKPDCIVMARGGGSMEDLWGFNDETLVRAIAQSPIPVLSAVGHETDYTICDWVADLRAPTPSAAAEILSNGWLEVRQQWQDLRRRMVITMKRDLEARRSIVALWSSKLISPKDRLLEQTQRVDELTMRLERAVRIKLERAQLNFNAVHGKLEMLSPLRVLDRGYSIVRLPSGEVIRDSSKVLSGKHLEIRLARGVLEAEVKKVLS